MQKASIGNKTDENKSAIDWKMFFAICLIVVYPQCSQFGISADKFFYFRKPANRYPGMRQYFFLDEGGGLEFSAAYQNGHLGGKFCQL